MKCKSFILSAVMACCLLPLSGIENRPRMRRACLDRIDSTLDLLWFKPTDNCGSFTGFNLYGRDNILSPFQLLGIYNSFAMSSLSLKLPNRKNWEFYLVYSKACNGTDSIFSDTIQVDNTPPLNSDLDSVSVDLLTQKTQIGWKQNVSPDVKGYIVYYITDSNSVISSTTGTSYLDIGARNPTVASVNYGVAAFDSCDNASLISSPHSTIFVQLAYDQCKQSINLNWSNYIGWPVEAYQVYLKTNAGSYQLVASLVSNINQFTYNFSAFGNNYCFFIRAIKAGGGVSSSSNNVCVNTSGIVPSKNSYIAKASVQNKQVELTLHTENGSSLQKINIYKAEDNGPFMLWQTVPSTGGIVELLDPNVNVSSKSYKYYFTSEGPCSLIFDTSQIAKTILLNVIMLTPGDQMLSWNLYNDFIKSSLKQELLLSDNPNFNKSSPWNIISTFGNSSITHQDFTTFGVNQEQICYCIRAIENVPNATFVRQDSSYSNIACVTADPIVFFPNAIQINGYNTSFFPKGVFIDYEKSSFQVYNRWGEIIYETSDIRKAWNGTFNNDYVESDVYAYHAVIVGINGSVLNFDGTITVLK